MLCTEISNNKHILCGCVVSCLFACLFVFFLKKLFVKDHKYVSTVHAGHSVLEINYPTGRSQR